MTKKITFRALRQMLKDLGFTETSRPNQFLFEHAASDTLLVFRPYHSGEVVTATDLAVVRKMLVERGLMELEMLESFIRKTPA